MITTKQQSVSLPAGVSEVASDVFRLGNSIFNWYLIRENGRFTLVDSGLPAYWGQLNETLAALGARVEEIDAVLITHAHLDHVGLAERVSRAANAPIYLHESEMARARKGGAQLPPSGLLLNFWRRGAFRVLKTAVLGNVFFGRSIRSTTALIDAEVLPVPGRLRVLFTPGHTNGSVSFWMEKDRVLFSGDSLVTTDMRKGVPCAPGPTPRGTHDDEAASLRSLRLYGELGHATLLSGHGDPWSGDLYSASEAAARAGIPRWR